MPCRLGESLDSTSYRQDHDRGIKPLSRTSHSTGQTRDAFKLRRGDARERPLTLLALRSCRSTNCKNTKTKTLQVLCRFQHFEKKTCLRVSVRKQKAGALGPGRACVPSP